MRLSGTDPTQAFDRPEEFEAKAYLARGFGAVTCDGDYDVLIEFDRWAIDVMRGRLWHASQVVAELPDGKVSLWGSGKFSG